MRKQVKNARRMEKRLEDGSNKEALENIDNGNIYKRLSLKFGAVQARWLLAIFKRLYVVQEYFICEFKSASKFPGDIHHE